MFPTAYSAHVSIELLHLVLSNKRTPFNSPPPPGASLQGQLSPPLYAALQSPLLPAACLPLHHHHLGHAAAIAGTGAVPCSIFSPAVALSLRDLRTPGPGALAGGSCGPAGPALPQPEDCSPDVLSIHLPPGIPSIPLPLPVPPVAPTAPPSLANSLPGSAVKPGRHGGGNGGGGAASSSLGGGDLVRADSGCSPAGKDAAAPGPGLMVSCWLAGASWSQLVCGVAGMGRSVECEHGSRSVPGSQAVGGTALQARQRTLSRSLFATHCSPLPRLPLQVPLGSAGAGAPQGYGAPISTAAAASFKPAAGCAAGTGSCGSAPVFEIYAFPGMPGLGLGAALQLSLDGGAVQPAAAAGGPRYVRAAQLWLSWYGVPRCAAGRATQCTQCQCGPCTNPSLHPSRPRPAAAAPPAWTQWLKSA